MPTFASFITRVRRELEEDTATVWEDASLTQFANDGYADLAMKSRDLMDEQYADVVANQADYVLPDYTVEPVTVVCNAIPLEMMDKRTYVREAAVNTSAGSPAYYAVFNGCIWLYPTPSASVAGALRFWRSYRPAPYTSASDTTLTPFGGEHDDAVAAFVKARCFEQIGDLEQAKWFQSLYDREAEEAEYEGAKAGTGFTAPREVH